MYMRPYMWTIICSTLEAPQGSTEQKLHYLIPKTFSFSLVRNQKYRQFLRGLKMLMEKISRTKNADIDRLGCVWVF